MVLPGQPNLSIPICPQEKYFLKTWLGVYLSNMVSTSFTRLHSNDFSAGIEFLANTEHDNVIMSKEKTFYLPEHFLSTSHIKSIHCFILKKKKKI
jgi:hypothetical protein